MHTEHRNLLTMAQAANSLPHKPAPSTLWRWARKGIPVEGERYYLLMKRIGGRVFIDPEDLREFIDTVTEADEARWRGPDREAEISTAEERVQGGEHA